MSNSQEQTIREAIEAQNRRLQSRDLRERAIESFFAYCELGRQLKWLSDRQIGQLVWDVVLDDLGLVTPAMSLWIEATERLFRSPAGGRFSERMNVPGNLPICPKCGDEMMHFIGISEPDYRECVSVKCGHRIREGLGLEEPIR